MNTIQTEWVSFAEQCIPDNAPTIQIQEMRRAFYAGALSVMMLLSDTEQQTNEAAQIMVENFCAELAQFQKDVEEGRA